MLSEGELLGLLLGKDEGAPVKVGTAEDEGLADGSIDADSSKLSEGTVLGHLLGELDGDILTVGL